MKIKYLLLLVVFNCSLLASVSAQLDTNTLATKYSTKLAGWTMIIPTGWEKLPEVIRDGDLKNENTKLHTPSAEGETIFLLSAIKSAKSKYPMLLSGLIARTYLKSGGVNTPQQYLDYQVKLLENANIAVIKTYGKKTIDGQTFISYKLNRDGSPINQKGLACFRGKYLFYITWIYFNDEDDQTIEKAVETSTFTQINYEK
ncbi:hypothetical protein ABIB40_003326 [Pedobacter sp. UYP30]|uniref:hypothetical protein n=1 Tax=Pedobacter sp. UYP30 TaxID=1756400 RepID=UPI00339349CE